ncbi:MAG: surface anchored protein, partial [Actinobacteria bacterium]|nr:surface anchored protein [Actinomycetota bacterium]
DRVQIVEINAKAVEEAAAQTPAVTPGETVGTLPTPGASITTSTLPGLPPTTAQSPTGPGTTGGTTTPSTAQTP